MLSLINHTTLPSRRLRQNKKIIYMKNKTGLQEAIGQIQKHKTFQIKLLNHYTNNSNHNQIQLHKHTN